MYRWIDNDQDALAGYVESLGAGWSSSMAATATARSYMVRQMQRRLASCKAIDADCCFLVPDQQQFVGALLLEPMRLCIEAHLARTPLVILSTVCARAVVEKAGPQARAFVWVEGLDADDHHEATAWYAEDRGANPILEGGRPCGPFLDELETCRDRQAARTARRRLCERALTDHPGRAARRADRSSWQTPETLHRREGQRVHQRRAPELPSEPALWSYVVGGLRYCERQIGWRRRNRRRRRAEQRFRVVPGRRNFNPVPEQ